MNKTTAIHHIHSATHAAHGELEHRGMPHTAHAMKVLGSSTAAIGHHVRGWASDVGGMMHGVLGTHHPKRKRRKGGKRRKLTAKQIAAGFGGKHRKAARKHGHRKKRHHFTAAQKRAGFGGKRAMHRRSKKGRKHR